MLISQLIVIISRYARVPLVFPIRLVMVMMMMMMMLIMIMMMIDDHNNNN